MSFWSKFKHKEEEPTAHNEPGMGSTAPLSSTAAFSDAREPGFSSEPKTSTESGSTWVPQAEFGADQSDLAPVIPTSPREEFPSVAKPRLDEPLTIEPPVERPIPTQPRSTASSAPSSVRAAGAQADEEIERPVKRRAQIEAEERIAQANARYVRTVKARRRFIGAVMLLVLVAVVVPFLFDKEAPPPAVTIPLRIPAENSVDLAKIKVPGSVAAAQNAQTKTQTAAVKPAEVKAQTPAADAGKTAVKPAAKTAAETPKPAAAQKQEPAKKEVAADKKPLTKDPIAAASAGTYFIQVIALSDEKKAAELLGRIKAAGVSGYTETFTAKNGKKLTRVRAGNFKTQKEAEDAKAKLVAAKVVSPKTAVQQVK